MLTLMQYSLNVCNLILFVVLFCLKYIVLSFIFKSQGIELGETATFLILAIVFSTSLFTCYRIYSFYSLRILVRKQVNDLLGDELSINAKGSSLEGANLDTEKYNSQNVSNLDRERLSEVGRQLKKTFDAETVSRQYDLTELEMDAVLHLGQEEQLKIIAIHLYAKYPTGIEEVLKEAYDEIDNSGKYTMLPLFFSPDMKSEASIFIPEKQRRDDIFEIFKNLIDLDNLDLDSMKREYLEFTPLFRFSPLQSFLKTKSENRLDQN